MERGDEQVEGGEVEASAGKESAEGCKQEAGKAGRWQGIVSVRSMLSSYTNTEVLFDDAFIIRERPGGEADQTAAESSASAAEPITVETGSSTADSKDPGVCRLSSG